MSYSEKKNNYRSDIDGLRAIAVLVVLFYHAGITGFAGGFVGVDIFFVISGYLITNHLRDEVERSGTVSLKGFYSRRIKRLFPSIAVVVLSTIMLWGIFLIGVKEDTRRFVKSITYSVFGMANFYFMNRTGGYFDSSAEEMPLLHFWSLAVEEQFYLIWPLSILLIHKLSKGNFTRFYPKILTGIIVLSFGFSCYFVFQEKAEWAFYMMPLRAWELAFGGLIVFLPAILSNKTFLRNFLMTLAFAGTVLPVFIYNEQTLFPGVTALPVVLGTAWIIYSGVIDQKNYLFKSLSHPLLVKFGLLSYGLYLWHWPLLAMAKVWYIGGVPPLWLRLEILVLSYFLSDLTLLFVDSPIRFGVKYKTWTHKKIFFTGLVSCGLLIVLAHEVLRLEKKIYSRQLDKLNSYIKQIASLKNCIDDLSKSLNDQCSVFGSTDKSFEKEIVVWGDSHAHSYFPIVEDLIKNSKNKGTLFSNTGPLSFIPNDAHLNILKNLKKRASQKETSVIITNRWMKFGGKETISELDKVRYLDSEKSHSGTLGVYRKELNRTLEELNKVGIHKVLIILPYPEFKFRPLQCMLRRSESCQTTRNEFESYRSEIVSIINETTKPYLNVKVVDPVPHLCNNQICAQIQTFNNKLVPIVRDENHPTVFAARFFASKIKDDLNWLIQ